MKSIVLSSVVMALLIFSGCADKEPAVDEKANQEISAQEVDSVKTETETETVSIDDAAVAQCEVDDSKEANMARLEREMTTIYFDYDKFNIRSDMQTNLTDSATIANDAASDFNIKLEGNCDEWGSDEYNFALGLKRASTVKKALIAEGVSESRITMVSYGESNPVCNDKTQACWAQNRRVDFKLLP